MYCYEGNVRYKKTWYGVHAEFDIEPGQKGRYVGHPDNFIPAIDPEVEFEEIHIEDEDGNQVELDGDFEERLGAAILDTITEDDCGRLKYDIYLN